MLCKKPTVNGKALLSHPVTVNATSGHQITFRVEPCTATTTQLEAGKRLFARLIARARTDVGPGEPGHEPKEEADGWPLARRPKDSQDSPRDLVTRGPQITEHEEEW